MHGRRRGAVWEWDTAGLIRVQRGKKVSQSVPKCPTSRHWSRGWTLSPSREVLRIFGINDSVVPGRVSNKANTAVMVQALYIVLQEVSVMGQRLLILRVFRVFRVFRRERDFRRVRAHRNPPPGGEGTFKLNDPDGRLAALNKQAATRTISSTI